MYFLRVLKLATTCQPPVQFPLVQIHSEAESYIGLHSSNSCADIRLNNINKKPETVISIQKQDQQISDEINQCR